MSSDTDKITMLRSEQIVMLRMYAEGKTAKHIAHELGCSLHTVNNISYRLRKIIGARTAAHAVAIAIRRGLII